jgi:hypothetical protein
LKLAVLYRQKRPTKTPCSLFASWTSRPAVRFGCQGGHRGAT